VFVWLFHRITGVLLIVLLVLQLATGFFQASSSNLESVKATAGLHSHALLSCLLVFVATFHGLYGLRTILLDLGVQRERLLFWAATVLGSVFFVVFLVLYFRLIAA
jgi:succinate dehydrogenase/fumarate reductase cytochrome b subunit